MSANDFLDHNEKVRLLNALRGMTEAGRVTWENPTESEANIKRNDMFLTTIPGFGFVLSSVDRDGVAPYQLEIYQTRSTESPTDSVSVIQMTPLDENGDEEINRLIQSLYEDVLRRVRRPDEIIRKLFEAIDRLYPEPPF